MNLASLKWRVAALSLFLVLSLLGSFALHPTGAAYPRVKGLCDKLFWPEGNMRYSILHSSRQNWNVDVVEDQIGTGDLAFARSQITPDAWATANGLVEAAQWPGVVFKLSWAGLFPKGYAARVIRAVAGDHSGVWIFSSSGKGSRSDGFVGHPGGNSGKPFQTFFLRWAGETVALNVLHRPDRRLENFVFRLGENEPVCRVVSDL